MKKLLFFVVLENLKLGTEYDGFLFLAEAARNPPILKSHHHVELELNLIVRGAVTYVVGGKRFTFERRTLLWMFPSQEHQLVHRSSDAQYYVGVFKPELIARSCRDKRYEGLRRQRVVFDGVLHTVLDAESFDLVRRIMDSLMREGIDRDVLNREAGFGLSKEFSFRHGDPDGLNAGLHHLLLLCWRIQESGTVFGQSQSIHPAIQKALGLIAAEGAEWDLARLARACGVSASHLSRLFSREIGVPLSRYRNSVRLGRFWEAYRSGGRRTLLEAVYEAGFGSYAQFYKVFANAYGKGPRSSFLARAKGG